MTRRHSTTTTTRLGAAAVALYVVVAAATTMWAPGRLRPLYDGFGSHPGQYNWVNPPKDLAEGNGRPEPAKAEVVLDAAGSEATSVAPSDGQALVALVPGALAVHPPDTKAALSLTPVDAGRLAPLPPGLRAEGNAYMVTIAYAPSGTKVAELAKPGSVGLTSAAPADTLLFSSDGTEWVPKEGRPLSGDNGLTGPLDAAGYYLAASTAAPRAAGTGSGSGATIVLVVAAAAVPVVLAWLFLTRRRPAPPGRGHRGAGRAGPRGGGPHRPRARGGGGRPSGKGVKPKGGKRPPPRRSGR